ncbi:hypothetical protein BGW36DRAFT_422516 [Talaromyces proteolyticus]|uniref:Zn(2)-C6 fungal-type domain-containing protein n=1 Tax=Talaromyces proteolyticus TaxID=1131652 RepID=A0AAD4L6F7_9EURO|nr:uncharacterized protein BGW36DRAFT_422516 [Talaromyces proteolyticus]KAH8705991.1 hypothetical protein BGW36DRAFT_422516 [Talaromyces proteolyticus]
MSGLRKYHTKSRNGCTNCKSRRVKCNLHYPQCNNCVRRNEYCSFRRFLWCSSSKGRSVEEQVEEHIGFNGYLSQGIIPPSISKRQPSSFPNESVLDTELLCHFISSCASSLALVPNAQFIWESEIPLHRIDSPFLSQAIMALSALHISYLQPPDTLRYDVAARKHFHKATSQFRSVVREITNENCISIFGFSLIVVMFQLRISTDAIAGPLVEDHQCIAGLDVIHALRTAWGLTPSLGPRLMKTRLRGLFSEGRDLDEQGILDLNHQEALSRLEMLNFSTVKSESSQIACVRALSALRYWCAFMGRRVSIWFHVVWWPAAITEDFLQLLRNKEPIALAIYSLWLADMRAMPTKWFTAGWAEGTLALVVDSLELEWRERVERVLIPVS